MLILLNFCTEIITILPNLAYLMKKKHYVLGLGSGTMISPTEVIEDVEDS